MAGDLDLDPSKWDEHHQYLAERLRHLEARNSQLREQKRKVETDCRAAQGDSQRLERELRHLRSEMEKLKAPPLVVGFVKDILSDGRVVLKSSAGPHFVVRVAEFVEKEQLLPGARVGLNQQTLSVVSVLPTSLDPMVYGAEVVDKPAGSYADIGGLDLQLRELREAVELPLLKPEVFKRIGIEPPKGVLLHGPHGTGKTLMARAVASHTNATFIKVVGSEMVQKYIGEGARLVRELFQLARERAPSILFIDELDAIGSSRYEASTSGDREVQRTLMQLLSEMDGFRERGEVKIVAATNRIDMLDSALLRPGRFDRVIEVPAPDGDGRAQIFGIHLRGMRVAPDVGATVLSDLAGEGATGADIKAACTEAGMFAIRDGRDMVTLDDFHRATRKVLAPRSAEAAKMALDAAFV